MKEQATVFVVDDDESVCRALRLLIDSVGLEIETYPNAQAFLDAYNPAKWGCLVLDVRMPGVGGLELQDVLSERGIQLPVIFITGHGDVPTSVRAFKGGAEDFIQKPFDDQTLLDAIQRAIRKNRESRSVDAKRAEILERVESLTRREREVFGLVVTGIPNREVASRMGISEKTVKTHRARVMEKMQAASLPELVLLAETVGICKPIVRAE
jgi:RNA polymerase sigma factor (sigma-70 family)